MLYRINAGAIPGDSWIQRDEGGGRIVGEVCHFVDALTFLCGSLPIEAQAITARDHADSTRADSPLTDDGSYVRVDTSELTAEQVVERLLATVEKG